MYSLPWGGDYYLLTEYRNIRNVGVSAASGVGIDEMFASIEELRTEFNEVYLPELLRYDFLPASNCVCAMVGG
jgi:hypothetical protein